MTPWQGGGRLTQARHAQSLAPRSWLGGAEAQGRGGGTLGGPVLTGLFPGQAQELKDTIAFLRDSSLAPN